MTDFTMKTGDDGVAIITWDVPGKSMNVLSMEGALTLDGLIDQALADDAVKGVVITSGKKDFAAGMDLNVIAGMRDQGGAQPKRHEVIQPQRERQKIEQK